ncbi:uncharacterized protein [Mycetomoellerius zeteki]|uniref:uncharacterized protein n=1 Tax=Mycetomoellerius zeteki TaxID=64791 RepID=UPI00084EB18C|nr:PREDICTED: uncharacterized protein LOC108722525 [Trachymyrmex zeteki]
MAISHSSHLFVLVAFVFCLLLPFIHVSDSYNYTDSRQFEKNLAIPRHRNTYNRIQRLPNYNWKPPDKYYGPRYSGKNRRRKTWGWNLQNSRIRNKGRRIRG